MGDLKTILGAAAVLFLLVAVLGGGFKFLQMEMTDKVGKASRVACLLVGCALAAATVYLVVQEQAKPSPHEPGPAASSAPTPTTSSTPPPSTSSAPAPPPTTTAPTPPSTTTAVPTHTPNSPLTSAVGYIEAGGYGSVAWVRDSPTEASSVLGEIPHGTMVYILCTTRGDRVTSAAGDVTSDLWNYIPPGTFVAVGGFVADTWVLTGTNDPTMPDCSVCDCLPDGLRVEGLLREPAR